MTEREPRKQSSKRRRHPTVTEKDKELFAIEENTVSQYKDAYWHLLETYGFLDRVYFADQDRTDENMDITFGKRYVRVSFQDLFGAILPKLITSVGQRLIDMGQTDDITRINGIIHKKWGTK